MRISDNEVKKILSGEYAVVDQIDGLGEKIETRDKDAELIQQVTGDVIAMPDREEFVAELKRKIEAGETGRMLALKDGNYASVPIDTLLGGTKSVDVDMLYDRDRYRPKLTHVEGMPMFLY